MTEQMIPAGLARDEARAVREWAERARGAEVQDETVLHAARVLLAVLPKPPTLADMTLLERAECRWMQCDVRNAVVTHGVLANSHGGNTHVLDAEGQVWYLPPADVTPRPDLPRMEWPSTGQGAEDAATAKVGTVIESADDPRLAALPVGTILRDCDGEEVVKRGGDWAGLGYVPRESEGTEFGPWTVLHTGQGAGPAPVPALPDGWRLADHPDHGRGVVTTPTPNSDGRVCFAIPSGSPLGYNWHLCYPNELTYLDDDQGAGTPDAVPESTLAVGSEWGSADALRWACEETGRDQIVVLDRAGDAYVWSGAVKLWETSSPMSVNAPFTILHRGKKGDQ